MVTRKRFRAYLEANRDEVFERVNPYQCPLAGYFKQFSDNVAVDGETVEHTSRANKRVSRAVLPLWAQQFISEVDAGGDYHEVMTGKQALEVLG